MSTKVLKKFLDSDELKMWHQNVYTMDYLRKVVCITENFMKYFNFTIQTAIIYIMIFHDWYPHSILFFHFQILKFWVMMKKVENSSFTAQFSISWNL